MKNLLKIVLIVLFLFCALLLSVRADALDTGGKEKYTVAKGAEGLEVYLSTETAEPIFKSENLGKVISYITEKSSDAAIYFSDITVSEEIYFDRGSYTLSGRIEFNGSCGMVIDGADIKLSSAKLSMKSGSVRIKRGRLDISESAVFSENYALSMDYSSDASLTLRSGSIKSAYSGGAVHIKHGSARVLGGKIENAVGAAIVNHSTLILLENPQIIGQDFDVITSTPPILSESVSEYKGSCKVKYESDFKKGEAFLVAYGATLDTETRFQLYDRLGQQIKVKFYETFGGIKEKNFLTAYLPYEIKVETEEKTEIYHVLRGESITLPTPEKREGYEFFGWCLGKDGGELYEPMLPIESDIVLYPSYNLEAPEFHFSSLSFVYDAEEHFLALSGLSHPLLSEGSVSYRWYKDGNELSIYGDKLSLENVKDSGKYKCLFTFSHKSDSVSVETPEISVDIYKKEIDIPKISSVYYNGEARSPELYSLSLYEVEKLSAVNAGVYPVKIKLNDPENYCFKDTEEEEISVDFIIRKAENKWLEEPTVKNVYAWDKLSPFATALFGNTEYLFSNASDGKYTSDIPKNVGAYFMKAAVSETDNYKGLESAPIPFLIMEDSVESLHIVTPADTCDYTAFESFKAEGLSVIARYVSGKEEKLSSSDVVVEYHSNNRLLFGDKTVILKYGGKSVFHSVTVSKAEYDISGIGFSSLEFEYSGEYKAPEIFGSLPIGLDGIPLSAVIVGGGTGVGSYGVKIKFSSESANYRIPESREALMYITPKTVEIFWESTEFVYDGTVKCPSAYYIDIFGKRISLSVSGARSYAGEYEARAIMSGENYRADSLSVNFFISRADYDLSSVYWTSSSEVYNGSEQSVTLLGLPEGVTVIGYSDNRATNAGKYTANVTLSYDKSNYNPPKLPPFEWCIIPAEYDMSGVIFEDKSYVYDGNEHFPIMLGSLPVGKDGSTPMYEFSGGVTNVSEGKVTVIISFISNSQNYNAPKETECCIEVTPKPVSVSWSGFSFVYTSALFAPSAVSGECDVTVLGAESEAGSYIATAKSLNSNYSILNSECEYEILKAENNWSIYPKIDGIYASETLTPVGESAFGKTEYLFSCDAVNLISIPVSAGKYYFKAKSEGDNNHFPIESEWIEFEITAVIPLEFFVELKRTEFLTLEKLSAADIFAYTKNNDKSISEISFDSLETVYQSGEVLAFSDTSVCFLYLEFSANAEISVKKRDYDLSDVTWEGTRAVYDGSPKTAELIGLPEGVKVISYTGNDNKNAGLYIISAQLSYDGENYNEPIIEDVIMTIEKQTVVLADIPEAEYTSKVLFPQIVSSELYSFSSEGAVNAGSYSVKFVLSDKENYVFENGKDTAYKDFEITKRKLTVRLNDVEIYLFGKQSGTGYEIIGGELLSGDVLPCTYEIKDGKIFASFDAANYEIEVISGNVADNNRLSPEDTGKFILIVVTVIFCILAAVIIITNRKRLRAFYNRVFSREDNFIPTMPIAANAEEKKNIFPDTDKQNNKAAKIEITPDLYIKDGDSEEKIEDESEFSKDETEKEENLPSDEEVITRVDASYADSVITDSLARDLIRRERDIETEGNKRGIINVDTLSQSFSSGERVDINLLKQKSLVPYDTGYIKVLARGIIDKPLTVYANDFSLSAVKMIALAGGKSIKAGTVNRSKSRTKGNFNKRT